MFTLTIQMVPFLKTSVITMFVVVVDLENLG